MDKKILYLDIDGVLANFDRAMEALFPGINDADMRQNEDLRAQKVLALCQCNPLVFETLEPIDGAVDAVHHLFPLYNVYFLSTPMWHLPSSFVGKRLWVEKQFGEKAIRRLILTHRKDLCVGDYLVDDRLLNGAAAFQGRHIHFGTHEFPEWQTTYRFLKEEARK